jgi:hypothetical protein
MLDLRSPRSATDRSVGVLVVLALVLVLALVFSSVLGIYYVRYLGVLTLF